MPMIVTATAFHECELTCSECECCPDVAGPTCDNDCPIETCYCHPEEG